MKHFVAHFIVLFFTQEMIAFADHDSNGEITKMEFLKMMRYDWLNVWVMKADKARGWTPRIPLSIQNASLISKTSSFCLQFFFSFLLSSHRTTNKKKTFRIKHPFYATHPRRVSMIVIIYLFTPIDNWQKSQTFHFFIIAPRHWLKAPSFVRWS